MALDRIFTFKRLVLKVELRCQILISLVDCPPPPHTHTHCYHGTTLQALSKQEVCQGFLHIAATHVKNMFAHLWL